VISINHRRKIIININSLSLDSPVSADSNNTKIIGAGIANWRRDERYMGDRQRFRRRLSARSTRRSHEEFSRKTARPRKAKATDLTKHAEHHA
jgi:hypothetical protein